MKVKIVILVFLLTFQVALSFSLTLDFNRIISQKVPVVKLNKKYFIEIPAEYEKEFAIMLSNFNYPIFDYSLDNENSETKLASSSEKENYNFNFDDKNNNNNVSGLLNHEDKTDSLIKSSISRKETNITIIKNLMDEDQVEIYIKISIIAGNLKLIN